MIREIFMNVPMMLVLTIGSYLLGLWVKQKSRLSLLHPFLICIPVIISILTILDIPCDFYMEGNKMIEFMLGPSVSPSACFYMTTSGQYGKICFRFLYQCP